MWESRICNPINNITCNTIYISTHISIYIFTYIPVSIHPQTGFLLRGGEKNHVFCVSLQSRTGRGLWAMRLEAFPSCAGMEKRIGMLNIHEN